MDLLKLVLERRGLTWTDYIDMSDPTHADLLDVDTMADALDDIYNKQEKIVVLPDFDMDGVMSGVVLHAGLSELGFNSELFIPSTEQGYGFDVSDVDELIRRHTDVKAIITCDVGISAFGGVAHAKKKGLKVLVTDHHIPQAGDLAADVAVNPNKDGDTYQNKSICGAFVAWQVLDYYTRHKRNDWTLAQKIEHLRVFAGIGTVSDMMTLVHENRSLVLDSVTISRLLLGYDPETKEVSVDKPVVPQFFRDMECNSVAYRNAFYGLSRLYYTYARQEKAKIQTKRDITSLFYGFYIAPVFNSLKRLNGDMNHAFGVFFDDLSEQQGHIDVLFETNEDRKDLVNGYMERLIREETEGKQPLAPYIYLTDAPGGVVGLIATRFINETGVPTLVLGGDDMNGYHGSGRSPEWYPFNTLMSEYNRELGVNRYFVAGHEGAFGFGANNYKDLIKLRDHLEQHTSQVWDEYVKQYGEPKSQEDILISLLGDGDVDLDIEPIYQFMHDIKYIEPFGAGWAEPVVKLRFKSKDANHFFVGADSSHVRFVFPDNSGFVTMVWSAADMVKQLDDNDIVEVTGHLSWNYFNQSWSVNLIGDSISVVER